jgi:ethanolaminephosphotransferase
MVSAQFSKAVLAYRYSSPNLSFLEWFCLNQFWERVTLWYPMWLAPNIITLMGFLCVIVAFAFNLSTSPEGLGNMPDHLYPALALLVFIYQTLDGSDGKQARRTKSGSALGELMDHGVDAVTTGMIASFLCDAFGFGVRSPWPWVLLFGAQVRQILQLCTYIYTYIYTYIHKQIISYILLL